MNLEQTQEDLRDMIVRLEPCHDNLKTDRKLLRESLQAILDGTYKRKGER